MKTLFRCFLLLILICLGVEVKADVFYWVGSVNSASWNSPGNWRIQGILSTSATTRIPGATDVVNIGVGYGASTNSYTTAPIVTSSTSCFSITFGPVVAINTLTVNANISLTTGAITLPPAALVDFSAVVTGEGTITCSSLQVGDGGLFASLLKPSTTIQFISKLNNLHIIGGVNINSTSIGLLGLIPLGTVNGNFSLQAGTTLIDGAIKTTDIPKNPLLAGPPGSPTFTIDMPLGSTSTPVLQLTNANAIDPASNVAGSIDFYKNTGGTGTCTVEYAGTTNQSIYTDPTPNLDQSPSTYQNIKFSGAGQKNIQPNNLTITGDWNSSGGKVDAVLNDPTVIFKGITQTLSDNGSNSGAGVVFKNVNFQGGGTKTISSGKFAISGTGILTMFAPASIFNVSTNGLLTLNSDANGSATVAPIPAGTSITGVVNVQRFVNGGNSYNRGYRLLSSPVTSGGGNANINYLKLKAYVTGTTSTAGGFDASGANNPSIYLFRENLASSNTSFTSGNFRGINNILSPPNYSLDNDDMHTIPVGTGYLFFFRGDRDLALSAVETLASYVPTNTTFTASGALNTGTITVKNWRDNTVSLLYTTTAGSMVQGLNLVGNPYASTINWEKFNRQGTLVNSSIYGSGLPPAGTTPGKIWVYNPKTKQYATYEQKKTALTLPADTTTNINPGISSDGFASNMIASGQGFFVRATAAGQALTFKESSKSITQPNAASLLTLMSLPTNKASKVLATVSSGNVAPSNTQTTQDDQTDQTVEPLIRLRMVKDSVNTDEIVIAFDKDIPTTYNEDKDAFDLGGNGALLSLSALSSDSVKTCIHRRPFPEKQQQVIPLFTDATTSGLYQLKRLQLSNLPAIYDVWLKDNLLKDSLDLKANSVYNFSIDKANAFSYGINRFQLVIRQNKGLALHLLNFKAVKENTTVKTTWLVENEADYTTFTIQKSTDNGKTWENLKILKSNGGGTYTYTDINPVTGTNLYKLKLNDINDEIIYSKVIPVLFSVDNTNNNVIAVYPNPIKEIINLTIVQTTPSSAYNIRLTNISGLLLKSVNISQQSWQSNVTSLIPGTYIIQVINNQDKSLVGICKFVKL